MNRTAQVVAALVLALALIACGGRDGGDAAGGPAVAEGPGAVASEDQPVGPPERTWVLVHTYGPERDIGVPEVRDADGTPRVTLDTRQDGNGDGSERRDGSLIWRAHDGCTDLEVPVAVDDASIAVRGGLPADDAREGCPTTRTATAVAYAEALRDVDRWRTNGELLELTGPETWMVFEPRLDDPPEGLVDPVDADLWDRPWVATSVTDGGAPFPLVEDTELTVSLDRFEGHQTIAFSAGCNGHSGQLAITPETLTMVAGMATEIGCDDHRHRQDVFFARFFDASVDWNLDDGRLTLTDGDTVIELEEG